MAWYAVKLFASPWGVCEEGKNLKKCLTQTPPKSVFENWKTTGLIVWKDAKDDDGHALAELEIDDLPPPTTQELAMQQAQQRTVPQGGMVTPPPTPPK